jgi:hypothetical protein
MNLIASIKAGNARRKAEREAFAVRSKAEAARRKEALRISGGTASSIAAQIHAHPGNIAGLGVIVDGETVETPAKPAGYASD